MEVIGSLTLLYCSDGEVISSPSRLIGSCQTAGVALKMPRALRPMLTFLVLRHGAAEHWSDAQHVMRSE